jgi:predicted ATPase
MIESLRLVNFKCFRDQALSLRTLTLLSGLNSSGKSTILQSLLLLRQSHQEGLLTDVALALNGKLVQLGTARDVLFEEADEDELAFEVGDDQLGRFQFRFSYQEHSDVLAALTGEWSREIWRASLFTDDFQYLRAERIGPRTSFAMSEYEVRHHRQLGSGGEYTVHFLSIFGARPVHPALLHPSATSKTLHAQTEAWMREISPGMRLSLERHAEMDLMTFGVSYSLGHQVSSSEYRPTNVGFGVTYALPVVVSILSAQPGSLVLLENPEAHLHPSGQVKMGELIALAAAAGVQVIVETHSDHVLNGIRVAARDRKLKPSQIALYHSVWGGGASSPTLTLIETDERGRLSQWPEGFFDQIERSLDQLLVDGTD